MFGFPPILYDRAQGVPTRFTPNAGDNSGFPTPTRREIFYSIKDGNWSDTNVWQTASGRVGLLPTANDDVYVRNIVSFTVTNTYTINNLYITGRLVLSSGSNTTLNVNNIFCDTGILDASSGSLSLIQIRGNSSRITKTNFLPSPNTLASGGVQYIGTIDQDILDLNYVTLGITSTVLCTKKLISNLTITGNLQIGGGGGDVTLELGQYDLTVTGTLTMGGGSGGGRLRKSASGNITFIGIPTFAANGIDFSGNPNIEFRAGFIATPSVSNFNTGTGQWSFTTNNQSINCNVGGTTIYNLDCSILIASNITLTTIASVSSTSGFNFNNIINGIDGTSKWIASTGTFNFATLTSVSSMTTGTWDFTTNANTIQYNGNYSATIPSYFTTFSSLTIGGTGTKTTSVATTVNASVSIITNGNLTLGGNLIINGNLSLQTNVAAILECSTYNLTVNGTTTTGNANASNYIGKNGAGNILFVGLVTLGNSGTGFNFSGNPNVEFRGGIISTNQDNGVTPNTGTGQWKFSTNNQTYSIGGSTIANINASILIDGITLTITQTYANGSMNINNSIDGTNASSSLVLFSTSGIIQTLVFTNISYYIPMATFGTFDSTGGGVTYAFNGNITLPHLTYGALNIGGTGTKTLGGNTTVTRNLGFTANTGTLECSTYNLTVNGTTTINKGNTLNKNGAGNILFVGLVTVSTDLSLPSTLNLSGNPTVEVRGGMAIINGGSYITSGTGTWTFSTNNQNIQTNSAITFNGNVLVSGAIVLTTTPSVGFTSTITIKGTLNGDNSSSIFRVGASTVTPFAINYQNATQPMATGILDTSTNANTWIYGLNNQNIKGGASTSAKQVYSNLTLNGTGTKTLQGYVSVLNTYTLTAPATLALNGYTLTNP